MTRRLLTEEDVDRSYHLLELLTVLAHAARNVEHAASAENMANSIGMCIDLAHAIASEIHDGIETTVGRARAQILPDSAAPQSTIHTLFAEWSAVRAEPAPAGDEDDDRHYDRYRDLQERISLLQPQSAQELAIQILVETNDFGSDWRDSFEEKLKALAGEVHS